MVVTFQRAGSTMRETSQAMGCMLTREHELRPRLGYEVCRRLMIIKFLENEWSSASLNGEGRGSVALVSQILPRDEESRRFVMRGCSAANASSAVKPRDIQHADFNSVLSAHQAH